MIPQRLISKPVKNIQGTITVAGDKSISHRALILGAIARGDTLVKGFLEGEDCFSTWQVLDALGVKIEKKADQEVLIHGVGKFGLQAPHKVLDCGNSGTSMRLLAGLLSGQPFTTSLSGDESLKHRPMERIRYPLSLMGAAIQTNQGFAPLSLQGTYPLQGIQYKMPQASAQVKSCLLLAGMYAQGTTTLIEPAPSRNHTENMLKAFAYPIQIEGNTLHINGGSECQGTEIQVPGDISSAAFFMVAATIIPDSQILIQNVGINPTRTGVISILQEMGANISLLNTRNYKEELVADILVQSASLQGIAINESLVPLAIDEFPILFIAAACAQGTTLLHGAKELRAKESDRIAVMVEGLQKLGIQAQPFADGVAIIGGSFKGGCTIESYRDHRIAMAFAIAGALCQESILINNCAAIATSFPGFLTTANKINLAIEKN